MAAPALEPHPDSNRLKRSLERCLDKAQAWSGLMYRAVGIEYANRRDLLTGEGSRIHGSRWTPRGAFAAVYGSLTPEVALAESLGTGGRHGIPPHRRMPLVMVAIEVTLQRTLDLTSPSVRRLLRVSRARMISEDWIARSDGSKRH